MESPESLDRPYTLDPETTTVHEALGALPGAADVFRRFGIDSCCGGQLPVAVAAEHHDVDLDRLMDELAGATATGRDFDAGT